MERTILFKAKKLSDGKWVKGDLMHKGNKTYIYNPHINERGFWVENEQVDPSTVCQFTGLKDKNGKEVWEHDLVYCATEGSIEYIYGDFCFVTKDYREPIPLIFLKEQLANGNILVDTVHLRVLGNKFDRKEGEK